MNKDKYSNLNLYFITYKKLGSVNDVCKDDYKHIIRFIKRRAREIVKLAFELDSKGKLHLHAMIELDRSPYIKKWIHKGFNVDIRPIYDKETLEIYMDKQASKNPKDFEEIVQYSTEHCLFLSDIEDEGNSQDGNNNKDDY